MSDTAHFRLKHFLVILITLFVFVGLLFVDKTSIQSSKNTSFEAGDNRKTNPELSLIDEASKKEFDQLERKLKSEELTSKKIEILGQLVSLAQNKGFYDYAVYYQKQLVALNKNDVQSLAKLGDLSLMALEKLQLDSSQYNAINQTAIMSYEKLSQIQPENTQWILKLGISQVRSRNSSLIMDGIRKLVDITKKDENNFDANYYLGLFSLESNQPEKAIKRFQKCNELQPNQAEVLLGLGQAYEMLNQNQQALKYYQQAQKYASDAHLKQKLQTKIELLNN